MSHTTRKVYPQYGTIYDTTRDKKKWYKPKGRFKYLRKRRRKAKEKDAFRKEKEIPNFPKSDTWDWN